MPLIRTLKPEPVDLMVIPVGAMRLFAHTLSDRRHIQEFSLNTNLMTVERSLQENWHKHDFRYFDKMRNTAAVGKSPYNQHLKDCLVKLCCPQKHITACHSSHSCPRQLDIQRIPKPWRPHKHTYTHSHTQHYLVGRHTVWWVHTQKDISYADKVSL